VLQQVNQSVQLFTPMPRPTAVGDQVRLVAGCDKTPETCGNRYGNILNFRGDAGTITPEMHDAARDFQAAFTIANLDRMPSASLVLVQAPGTRGTGDLTDAQVGARERVGRAMDVLGGIGSPAGSSIWHVVGLQCSIREWALREGWGGRPVKHEQAQGMLVAALGVLAKHYGYGYGRRRA
jgi:hypothetical protein